MASLMFLGLNPLFVSPRDEKEGKPDPINNTTSVVIPNNPCCSPRSSKNNKRKSSKLKRVVSPKKASKPQKNQNQNQSSKDKVISSQRISNNKRNKYRSKSKSKSKIKSKNKSMNNNNNNNKQIQINNNYLSLTYNHNLSPKPRNNYDREKSRSFISNSGSSETSDADSNHSRSNHSDISITAEINETDDGNIVYQILTKQRNEAIEYSQKLESKLQENHVQFALKLDQLKQELKQYKNTNQYLKEQNGSLKREIQKLKDKLMCLELNQNKNFDGLLKKRKKINSNKSKKLPNYIRKDFKQQDIMVPDKIAEEKRKDMTLRLNQLRYISEQQQKQKQVQQQQQEQQYQIQIQDIDEEREQKRERERERERERDERPFIKHGRSPTESTEGSSESSLSACAVNLSFPSIKTPLTHIRQLTTILEHKSIPQTMLGLMVNSDNNSLYSENITDDDDDMDHMDHMDHMDIQQISMEKREISADTEKTERTERTETTEMHSESMSYMSNNTIMLKELSSINTIDQLDIDNEGIMDNDKDNDNDNSNDNEENKKEEIQNIEDEDEDENEDKNNENNYNHHNKTTTMIINDININNDFEQKLSNYSSNYTKQDLDEHDQIITSPIKIGANQSFKVRL